jgi:hypothetical protein
MCRSITSEPITAHIRLHQITSRTLDAEEKETGAPPKQRARPERQGGLAGYSQMGGSEFLASSVISTAEAT